MASAFKPPPFNYCDYRCEQCDEREHCRVYKDNEERILNHYIALLDLECRIEFIFPVFQHRKFTLRMSGCRREFIFKKES